MASNFLLPLNTTDPHFTGLPIVTTGKTKALGSSSEEAFRIESSDSQSLFQVMTNGDAKIAGILTVSGTSGGTSTFNNTNLEVAGNLTVKGTTILGDDATLDITTINGLTTIKSGVTKASGSSSTNVFHVVSSDNAELFEVRQNGDAVIAGKLTVNSTGSSFAGNVSFQGDVDIGGNLTVAGNATATADLSGNNLTLTGDLIVKGNTTLGDSASADTTTINGVTTIKSSATKSAGSSSVNVFQVVDSAATPVPLFEVRQNGDAIIGGVLTVNGTGTSTFAGDVSIGGHLSVAKTATVSAALSGTDLTLTGNLVVEGNTTLGNDANTDTTTIKGVTKVISKTTKALGSGTIDVFRVEDSAASPLFQVFENGDAKIANNLTVAGTASVSAAMSGSNLTLSGNLIVNGNTTLGDASTDTITINGAMTNVNTDIAMSNKKITGLATPSATTDAVNKTYVDGRKLHDFTLATADVSLNSHKLTNVTDPSVAQDAATKNYVDTRTVSNFAAPITSLDMNGQKIIDLATPVDANDAANKAYVDNVVAGLDFKQSVKVATVPSGTTGTTGVIGNIAGTYNNTNKTLTVTATGTLTIDGKLLAVDDRVLVKNQTNAIENGLYKVTNAGGTGVSAVLTRTEDADGTPAAELSSGLFAFVEDGTINHDSGWVLNSPDVAITVGTSLITFVQFSGAGSMTASTGLTQTGTTFSLVPATTSTLGGVIVGDGINVITTAGATQGTISLKQATASQLGAIKVGTGLSIDAGTGVLSVNVGTGTGGAGALTPSDADTEATNDKIVKRTSTAGIKASTINCTAITSTGGSTLSGAGTITTTGNITTTSTGAITSATTITAGTGLTVTSGGLNVTAGGATITAGNLAVNSGNISASGTLSLTGKVAKVNNVTADGLFGVSTTVKHANDVQLTTTTATDVVAYSPGAKGNYIVYIYFRVVTATTNITINVTYADGTGVQTIPIIAGNQEVGSYSLTPIFLNANTGTAITVNTTAGTANNVYISANVVGF